MKGGKRRKENTLTVSFFLYFKKEASTHAQPIPFLVYPLFLRANSLISLTPSCRAIRYTSEISRLRGVLWGAIVLRNIRRSFGNRHTS